MPKKTLKYSFNLILGVTESWVIHVIIVHPAWSHSPFIYISHLRLTYSLLMVLLKEWIIEIIYFMKF